MRRIPRILAFATLALICSAASANDLGYSTDVDSNLWLIDFTTGSANLIGNTQVFYEAIALRADGTLFGTTDGGSLYTISTVNAASTLVGSTALGNIEALDFNGVDLVGVNFNSTPSAYSLNQTNGAPTLLATSNVVTGNVRSGALLDPGTILIRGDTGGDTLYRMALAGGATTPIGAMGFTIYGMDFIGATLYGVDGDGGLYTINTSTGLASQFADTGDQLYLSLTTIPIPEPASGAMFATGVFALIGVASRRRR